MSWHAYKEPECVDKPGPVALTIKPRPRDLGGFEVARVLPARQRRMVGPFIFLDHAGPAQFDPGQGADVRPHPHIGLATVTYLFDGAFLHRDSLGTEQLVEPGAVNWMTAGRGIVHSERTPPADRRHVHGLHGLQSWVALPKDREEVAPSFQHHERKALPEIEQNGVTMRLVAGSAYGEASPVMTLSPLFYLDVAMPIVATRPIIRTRPRLSINCQEKFTQRLRFAPAGGHGSTLHPANVTPLLDIFQAE